MKAYSRFLLHRVIAMLLCFLFCYGAHAEQVQAARAIGTMSEVSFGYMSCTGNKPYGSPLHFVIRTNRPDIFLNNFLITQVCVTLAKKYLDNPKKYRNKIVPLYAAISTTQQSGNFEYIHCKRWRGGSGYDLMYEFTLPWIHSSEVASIVHETRFRMCLMNIDNEAESVTPGKHEYSNES